MRPDRPEVETDADLAAHIDSYAGTLGGRLGVFLGFPRGPDDFEVVYRSNAEATFASASVIKLPILYALYETYDGRLDELTRRREITPENRVTGSGLFHLLDDPDPSLEDLARAMIAISDNAATNELIDEVGMERVEESARDLGMTDTRLRRKMMATLGDNDLPVTGEWPEGEPANATTPLDCARFFADVVHEATLSSAAYDRLVVPLEEQKYATAFPRYLPFETPVAHKTGSLPTAALDTGYVSLPDGDAEVGAADPGDPPLVFAVFADRLENGGDGSDALAEIGEGVYEWLKNRAE
ncbi:class A beta-lactamase-related serine hydrolase (plasmid) [Halorussus salilacus]|uniref:serine hydrolase n=1 Tax=Halorussus salilacus TaxID=2953750 RepID=UPI0020A02B7F|nr:serine hydrolase [Halorussus salilacus]USZ69995.1 class A beta-lactamase-related serine hydrolase [Halorussus salilacus]